MPLDPVVQAFAARVKASSLPEARALVPLSAAARSALLDHVLGPAEEAELPEEKRSTGSGAPRAPGLLRAPSPPQMVSLGGSLPSFGAGPPGNDQEPLSPSDVAIQAIRPVDPHHPITSASPARAPLSRRWWLVALVAALGLLVPGLVLFRAWIPSTAAVAYDLRAEGDMPVRGDTPPPADAPLHLRPSTRLRVVLAPQKPFADVALRMLVVRDGKARLLRPPYENDGQGKLTIDRPAREALGDQVDGPAELVWVLGRMLPDDAAIEWIAVDHGTVSPPWGVIVRRAVVFEDWGGALRTAPGDIEFAGCKAMIRGPRCEMDPGAKLVIWAPWEAGEAQVAADGQPVKAEAIPAAGGTRWTVTVAAGTRQITLSSTHLESPFQLAMADALGVPAITEAARLVDENRLPDAEKALAAMTDETPYAKLAATRQRARIARRRGNLDGAESLYREAVSQASAAGRLSDELENRHLLALQAMMQHRDHAAAERELEASRALEAQCPPWQVDGAYYRGTLAEERGRYAEALAAFTGVRRSAARLDLPDMERIVLQPLAEMLSVWGRDEEAIGLLQRAYSLTPDRPCDRGEVLTNWAWAEYRAADTRAAHERAASRAEEALRVLGGSACGTARATAEMNAALTQAAAGRTKDARSALDRIVKGGSSNARMAPWTARLELELDRAEEPARALATAARLEREMAQSPLPEMAFEAALGRAAALDALNRPDEASTAYEEASRRETAWGAAAPLGEGRSLFFERQRSSFRAWVDLAVRRAEKAPTDAGSQRAAALVVGQIVRQSLGRFFATLLPLTSPHAAASALLAPPEGEVQLYYHPLQEGWIAVAVGTAGAALKRLPGQPKGTAADLSAALLAPFKEVLAGARRVVVFADRALRDVELENLPWNGGVLSDQVIVSYGVGGQPLPATRADSCGSKPFALLVLDPSRNLAGARRAGEHLAARLGAGAAVLAGESATRRAVLEALSDPCIRLFQYDGHAVFGAKKDGIEAALSLADGPLSLSTLLDPTALPRVPDRVVLSGCETAREEGLGIAHAFLERGSRQVLATTAKVDDALSAQLMETLYEQDPRPAAEWDLAAALRTALRSLRGPGAGAGPWAAFRVLVP
jgi:tetratricopeptide (TPR) repeat protein